MTNEEKIHYLYTKDQLQDLYEERDKLGYLMRNLWALSSHNSETVRTRYYDVVAEIKKLEKRI